MDKKVISKVLDGMLGAIDKEQIELYKKVIGESGIDNIKSMDEFFFGLVYPYEQFLRGLIKTEISTNNDIEFLLIHSQFVQDNFEKIIENKEGGQCCADKSSTIMSGLLKWFNTEKKIEFDYSQQYTFHLPKKVFMTHDEILKFYEALKSLYYGNSKAYLEEMNRIAVIPQKN